MQNQSSSSLKVFFQNKWVKIVLFIDSLALIATIIIFMFNMSKNSIITFNISPIDADIYIGKEKYSNESYKIAPGTYEINISHDGLDSKTLSVKILPHHSVTVSTFLSQNGNFDFYTLKENFKSFQKLREIASKNNNRTIDNDTSAEKFLINHAKKTTIYNNLPIIDETPSKYGIDLGVHYMNDRLIIEDGKGEENCKTIYCIHIADTTGEKKDYALSIIDKFGFDHNDYEIFYEEASYE